MLPSDLAAALASDRRLSILNWLKEPRAHFPPQVDGDLVRDGVCSVFIARKLGVTERSRVLLFSRPQDRMVEHLVYGLEAGEWGRSNGVDDVMG